MELFYKEIMQLKEIFEKNGCENELSGRCLQTFLNKIYSRKFLQHKVPNRFLYFPPLFREIVAFNKVSSRKNYP